MNPLTNTKNQTLLNERELALGYTGTVSSWHRQYKDSAWIFVGNLNYDLTEGDVICVFSQYGEVANINMVRDQKTGKSKGFAFVCYEDQRSTVLATDNFNGITLAGRTLRVDHVERYKVPKDGTLNVSAGQDEEKRPTKTQEDDLVASFVREHGCGPEALKQLMKIQDKQKKLDKRKEKQKTNHGRRNAREREDNYRRRRSGSDEYHRHDRIPDRARQARSPLRPNPSPSYPPPHRNPSPDFSPPRRKPTDIEVKPEQLSPPSKSRSANRHIRSRDYH